MKPITRSRYSYCYPAIVLVLWLVFVPLIAAAESFTGKVVGISDGDTLSVLREGKAVKVRLHGVEGALHAQHPLYLSPRAAPINAQRVGPFLPSSYP